MKIEVKITATKLHIGVKRGEGIHVDFVRMQLGALLLRCSPYRVIQLHHKAIHRGVKRVLLGVS